MTGLRIGSLFSGYEGLGMAVQQVLGGELAWVSDIDLGACKILAHRYPDVPNLGDVAAVDWSTVVPVDVLTGGFPCQDVSAAGKRAGLHSGTRSGLWAEMVRAIEALRPSLVVAENVRGILSACATSELEPCPRCLGDSSRPHRSVLRAAGRVVGDLAELGYVCRWGGLPASAVGAPHARYRVFFAAWPVADTADDDGRWGAGVGAAGGWPGFPAAHPGGIGRIGRPSVLRDGWGATVGGEAGGHAGDEGRALAPPYPDGKARGRAARFAVAGRGPGSPGFGSAESGRRGGDSAADPERDRREHRVAGGPATPGAGTAGTARTPGDSPGLRRHEGRPESAGQLGRSDAAVGGAAPAADPDVVGRGPDVDGVHGGQPDVEWGAFGPAVRRWEGLTRPAPAPTVQDWDAWQGRRDSAIRRRRSGAGMRPVGMRGSMEPLWMPPPHRLSPVFVEWMMGLPLGHVTAVPGLSRPEMLKTLGNGVVPQQAAAALRLLLADVGSVAA